mmetsp:Transcript_24539/g.61389  ORF Transcript_24539/g.61389 Transcript_24539/m.61389 type:complete len:284 (+) Transcript_24539:389-1240(+)
MQLEASCALTSCGCEAQLLHLAFAGVLQIPRQPEEIQNLNGVPREVDLPPLQPVPARALERMVVVVPTLAEGQNADHPIVHRVASGVPVLEPPDVADRVHGPSDVPDPDHAEEEAPKDARQAPERVQADDRQGDCVQGIGLLEEAVEPLTRQVRGILLVGPHPRALRVEQPPHVRPPEAVERRVHVVLGLRASVVVAMRGHPVDRVALECQGATVRKDVLEPLRGPEGAVGELPVVGQGDPEQAGDDVADDEASERLPSEVEWCRERAQVDGRDERGIALVFS